MQPEADQVGKLAPYKSITLDIDNSDPRGTWSDGEVIWVSDSGNDKLYAYDLSDRSRLADEDLDLHSNNDDPREFWSDGVTIWVHDTDDKHAYAYRLSGGTRWKSHEFWTAPDNSDPVGGLTGHGMRFWVADGNDSKLYAYGKINTPPSFSKTSARFKIHRTIGAGGYVGAVPRVIDPDEDTITYLLTSAGFGHFRLDSQTGEIFVRDDSPGFSGGEEFTLTVDITDSKGGLDGFDPDHDDAINVTVKVTHNSDPVFNTPGGTVFSIAESAATGDTIAQLDITDLDDDSLLYESVITPKDPFLIENGAIKLMSGSSLDYESANSYQARVRISDGKNESGQMDLRWDDSIRFTIQVTNVDEAGEIIPSSAHPQVDTGIVATLTDSDKWILATETRSTG